MSVSARNACTCMYTSMHAHASLGACVPSWGNAIPLCMLSLGARCECKWECVDAQHEQPQLQRVLGPMQLWMPQPPTQPITPTALACASTHARCMNANHELNNIIETQIVCHVFACLCLCTSMPYCYDCITLRAPHSTCSTTGRGSPGGGAKF